MTTVRRRSLGTAPSAIVCAVTLAATSMLAPAFGLEDFAKFTARVRPLADEGWIMGGTVDPLPDPGYISDVLARYLQPSAPLFPDQPTFPTYHFEGLTTPEQFCPISCLPPPNPNLNFGDSVDQGVAILNNAIVPQLQDGDNVAVFGYSQSATIATQVMNNLVSNPPAGITPGDLSNLHVVLIGDPNNPIGGILDRYQFPDGIEKFSLTPAPQHLPFLNVPLSMDPTPTTPFPTDVYTAEYDGWGNWPQDQLDILGFINSGIGIGIIHPTYPTDDLSDVIKVGTIGDTNFYMLPENLPMLQFMFDGGTAGQFFGDFFSPWLRLITDWGYGNAGDPAVDGLYPIADGSPYEQAFGVAGGPWAETPLGTLYAGSAFTGVAESGVAGIFQKLDPLQMLTGMDNALIQSLIGPWADVAAGGEPLSQGAVGTIDDITGFLQAITGYDLINAIDQGLVTVWNDAANAVDLGDVIGPTAVLDGPVIPGQPLIDLVGVSFDIFNFFGA